MKKRNIHFPDWVDPEGGPIVKFVSKWLKRFLGWVYESVPRRFTAYYLVAILGFAVAYSFHPTSFHHSTLQHEQPYRDEALALTGEIEKQLLDNYQRNWPNGYSTAPVKFVVSNPIEVSDIRPEDFGVSFAAKINYYRYFGRGGSARLSKRFRIFVYTSFGDIVKVEDKSPIAPLAHELLVTQLVEAVGFDREVTPKSSMPTFRQLFDVPQIEIPDIASLPMHGGSGVKFKGDASDLDLSNDNMAVVEVPSELSIRILGFQQATEFTSDTIPGHFGRMLYFSACTITTLGLGDIVPLTGGTRFLVILESVLGIVLVGFFLNAVANPNETSQ